MRSQFQTGRSALGQRRDDSLENREVVADNTETQAMVHYRVICDLNSRGN